MQAEQKAKTKMVRVRAIRRLLAEVDGKQKEIPEGSIVEVTEEEAKRLTKPIEGHYSGNQVDGQLVRHQILLAELA